MTVAAVVFDNDGLLLDTEEAWTRAEVILFDRHGSEFTYEHKRDIIGAPMVLMLKSGLKAGRLVTMVKVDRRPEPIIGAIARMIDMDIERGLIAYAVRGVISQRLVRKICTGCGAPDPNPRPEFVSFLGLEGMTIPYRKGTGCTACDGTGYHGRTGIFEVLTFDDNLRAMIVEKRAFHGSPRKSM